jgi:hypothetical protein
LGLEGIVYGRLDVFDKLEFEKIIRIALKVESKAFLTEVGSLAWVSLGVLCFHSHRNAPVHWVRGIEALDVADPQGELGGLLGWCSSHLRELLLHSLNLLIQDLHRYLAFSGRLLELILDVEVVLHELLQLNKAVSVDVALPENLIHNLVSVICVDVLLGQEVDHLLAFDAAVTV